MAIDCNVTQDQFERDCNKCWNDVLKRDMTPQEQAFAWHLWEDEVFKQNPNMSYNKLHAKVEVPVTGKITIRTKTWFSWILSSTYKNFNLGVKTSNQEGGV